LLFLSWLLLVAWLFWKHVVWRDEVRAFSLALSGSSVGQMLRNVQGEGHPGLWYLILRALHDVFPTREVLPAAALVIWIAAIALFTWKSPFRTFLVALVLFSLFGAFDYAVIARNYGIAALVMFALAAVYPRVKRTLWFGLVLAVLANTNVPSTILAGAFLLFRFFEMLTDGKPTIRDWSIFAGNAFLSLVGAFLSFVLVYPPMNEGAVSLNYGHITLISIAAALADGTKGFSNLLLNAHGLAPPIILWTSCLAFVRRPPALLAALAGLAGLKLFFFFVYPSGYRHEALFVVFLLALAWIEHESVDRASEDKAWTQRVALIGRAALLLVLAAQTLDLGKPLLLQAKGLPFSQSANAARLIERPDLKRAIVIADPDLMLEPLPYYIDNPLWFLREERFDRLFFKTSSERQQISLDTILVDAARLNQTYRRPVVILLQTDLDAAKPGAHLTMYRDSTSVSQAAIGRFRRSTRLVARLGPAITDEHYDLYVYRG